MTIPTSKFAWLRALAAAQDAVAMEIEAVVTAEQILEGSPTSEVCYARLMLAEAYQRRAEMRVVALELFGRDQGWEVENG